MTVTELIEQLKNLPKEVRERPLTLPWLKPRDSCELGLLALGR